MKGGSRHPRSHPHWTYDDLEDWSEVSPICEGEHQSPINIDPLTAKRVDCPHLFFGNYHHVIPAMKMKNNGHTAEIDFSAKLPRANLPYIGGGGFGNAVYHFNQVHFHWGGETNRGGEHLIQNKRYPAELHIVHYNAKYGSYAAAKHHADGVAVLAILIEVGESDNLALQPILDQFPLIATEGQNISLKNPFPLANLLPSSVASFYRYNGSLTIPTCYEIVAWTVFDTPITASARQLAQFRLLMDAEGEVLENNYRPIQKIYNRIVTYRADETQLVPQVSNSIADYFSFVSYLWFYFM